MEGIHHRDRCGDLLGAAVLNGEPVHRDHLDPVASRLGASLSHCLNACFERPSTMSSSRAGRCRPDWV